MNPFIMAGITSQIKRGGCVRVRMTMLRSCRTIGSTIRAACRPFAAVSLLFLGTLSAPAFTLLDTRRLQSNGTLADVQAAVNAAPDNSTIQLPNGTFTWNAPVLITKSVHLVGQSARGVTIQNRCSNNALLTVTPSRTGIIEVANLRFVEAPRPAYDNTRGGLHLRVDYGPGAQPVLVHDCYFETNGNVGGCIRWETNGGVIWSCTFYTHQKDNSGIQFKNAAVDTWKKASTMGTADAQGTANTYVEDCTFQDVPLQAMDFDDGSRVVVRHNLFSNSAISSHGQDTSPFGTRHWEVYNNTFSFKPTGDGTQFVFPQNIMNFFLYLRGGTGVIFNNQIDHIETQAGGNKPDLLFTVFSIRRARTSVPCQTHYPAARQLGQSWVGAGGYAYVDYPPDGTGYGTDPVYIWGNTGSGHYEQPTLGDWQPDECGHGLTSAQFIQSGRDYITGQAKPGYRPYPYPHPLRSGVGVKKRARQNP